MNSDHALMQMQEILGADFNTALEATIASYKRIRTLIENDCISTALHEIDAIIDKLQELKQ